MRYSWHFNQMRPSDKCREPIQGEFFATDAINNPGEALVREGIQNSLDARNDKEQVVVRIKVSKMKEPAPRNTVNVFLHGLDQHLKAEGNGLREPPEDSEDCPFLVFEDFGTTGLTGNPEEWNPPQHSKNHFYHFFRAEGRSDKSEKDIGRWGVGKQVFPRVSRINTIFGLTVRSSDQRRLLMGMAVLKSHNVNGIRYAPDGLLGQPFQADDTGPVLPIEDGDYIESLSKTFDLHRENQPGLSIIVPWYDIDSPDQELIKAVLRSYFWPILHGSLKVTVETDNVHTVLEANTLESELRKIGNDLEHELLPVIELARWAGSLNESDYFLLNAPSNTHAWEWSKDLFPDSLLPAMRNRYEQGEKLAIRVPVHVREKNQAPRPTFFDVFLQRDGSEQRGRPVFVREGIIIPDVRAPYSRGIRSLVIAEDGPIAAFLGDSENPAHTQWQKDTANFKTRYSSGVSDLQFVIRSVYEIMNIMTERDKQIDRTLLSDLFSIPVPPDEKQTVVREKKKPVDTGHEPDTPTPPAIRSRSFIIDQIEGGFIVRTGFKIAPK
ncbi:MAG: hypothetical protein ACOX5R_08185 [bacterium]|jgi:hypothetical protein